MADVFGTIGNEQVELNNAATEATLRQLLQATLAAGRQSATNISNLARQNGLDPAAIEASNRGMNAFGRAAVITGGAWAGLTSASSSLINRFTQIADITAKLTNGNAQASDIFNEFGKLKGPIGQLANGIALVVKFQEQQLESYRDLTKAGVNFGGSLTDLRMAAANSYMTMTEFNDFVKRNTSSLAVLGTTTDEGARAFVKVSKEFNDSRVGVQLRALGYTSEEMNNSLVKFMALQGKSGLQDSQRMAQVQSATATYMSELDALTKLTGANKEALEQEQKKAEMNAAFQAKLMSLAPAEQAKLKAAYDKAAASGIKGATDLVMSTALGIAPVTKESQLLSGVMPQVAAGMASMANTAMQTGMTMKDVNGKYGQAIEGAVKQTKGMEQTIGALAMSGNEAGAILNSGLAASIDAQKKGVDSAEKYNAAYEKASGAQKTQVGSQASAAAETQKTMQELSQTILGKLMPVVSNLLSVLNPVVQKFNEFLIDLIRTPEKFNTMQDTVGALTAAFVAYKMAMAIKNANAAARGTLANPMIVRTVGSGGIGALAPGGRMRGLRGGAGALLGGMVLGAASDYATDAGYEGVGAGLDIAGDAASFAGTGAMMGSVVPGLGTVAGGVVGGLAGGAYGLYKNWGTLFGGSGNSVPTPSANQTPMSEITAPTAAGTSAISTTSGDPFEKMAMQLERLNTQTGEMIRYLKDTAEQARRNVDATKRLGGNLFPTP